VNLKVNAYLPSEWTERSAEHPFVTNGPRLLAEKFKEVEPNIEVEWWLSGTRRTAATSGTRLVDGPTPPETSPTW
jgi:hypothetical protein